MILKYSTKRYDIYVIVTCNNSLECEMEDDGEN